MSVAPCYKLISCQDIVILPTNNSKEVRPRNADIRGKQQYWRHRLIWKEILEQLLYLIQTYFRSLLARNKISKLIPQVLLILLS